MPEFLVHSIIHALKDSAMGIPVLFLAYLFMEILERSRRLNEDMLHAYSQKAGPAVGGLLGVVPQCGISGAAASLFSTGSITVGTMLAVFFATSDEMLPIMLSSMSGANSISAGQIVGILVGKAGLGIVLGYIVDAFASRLFGHKDIHSFCEREHCECEDEEGSVWHSAFVHTIKIAIMLVAVNFLLTLVMELGGEEWLKASIISVPVVSEIILAIVGLIPNCAVSVVITEAYLSGIVGLGGLFAGLLSNAGIGLLVLFRSNANMKENVTIVALSCILSAISGILIGLVF